MHARSLGAEVNDAPALAPVTDVPPGWRIPCRY